MQGGDYRGDGGTRPPPKKFWLGGRKGKCPPLIAHLVKFLGHFSIWINWITALVESLECPCIVSHIYNFEMFILNRPIRASVSLAVT